MFIGTSCFTILGRSAMNTIALHAFVLRNMLRAEGMVFSQDNPYSEQHDSKCNKSYND